MVELISVHVPKCAGTSFLESLTEAYGPDRVLRDYGDRPIDPTSPMNLDPEGFFSQARRSAAERLAPYSVVHGHFNLRKYDGVRALRATFLREPIDRLISHYYYWQNTPPNGHTLHQYVLTQALSLIEFARLPMIRSFYAGVFFVVSIWLCSILSDFTKPTPPMWFVCPIA